MDTQETKIRKGQAYNLAIHDAVANKKENDAKYIYKRFVFYFEFGAIVQGSDIDMIQEVINSKDFDKAMETIRKTSN